MLQWSTPQLTEAWTDHTLQTPFEHDVKTLVSLLSGWISPIMVIDKTNKTQTFSLSKDDTINITIAYHASLNNTLVARWFGELSSPTNDCGYIVITQHHDVSEAYLASLLGASMDQAGLAHMPWFVLNSHTGRCVGGQQHCISNRGSPAIRFFHSEIWTSAPDPTLQWLDGLTRMARSLVQQSTATFFTCTVRNSWLLSLNSLNGRRGCLRSLAVTGQWPAFPEGAHAENAAHSTLRVSEAPIWTIVCAWNETSTPIHDGLAALLRDDDDDVALKEDATNVTTTTTNNNDDDDSIDDIVSAARKFAAEEWNKTKLSKQKLRERAKSLVMDILQGGSPTTLFSRFAVELCRAVGKYSPFLPPKLFLSMCWDELCHMLRKHFESRTMWWENQVAYDIPPASRMPDTFPSLAHQKVHVLAICSGLLAMAVQSTTTTTTDVQDNTSPSLDLEREKQLDFHLVHYPDRPAFAPRQQSLPVAFLEADHDRLFFLNPDAKAELQSQSLISDMKAFKYANPGCEFVDFLQWFSPRDVLSGGQVSERMQDGFWREAWDGTAPLSAKDQKQIFDPEREGEKALHWLETALAGNHIHEFIKTQIAVEVGGGGGGGDTILSRIRHSEIATSRVTSIGQHGFPSFIVEALCRGNGRAEFTDADKVYDFVKECGGGEHPDKREVCVEEGNGGINRLYMSSLVGEWRLAVVKGL